jgi:hypothetical protein
MKLKHSKHNLEIYVYSYSNIYNIYMKHIFETLET